MHAARLKFNRYPCGRMDPLIPLSMRPLHQIAKSEPLADRPASLACS